MTLDSRLNDPNPAPRTEVLKSPIPHDPSPSPVSTGPIRHDLSPSPVSTGPIPHDLSPSPVSTGPILHDLDLNPVSTGPIRHDPDPNLVSTSPILHDPSPSPVSTGPIPHDLSPSPVSTGPIPVNVPLELRKPSPLNRLSPKATIPSIENQISANLSVLTPGQTRDQTTVDSKNPNPDLINLIQQVVLTDHESVNRMTRVQLRDRATESHDPLSNPMNPTILHSVMTH